MWARRSLCAMNDFAYLAASCCAQVYQLQARTSWSYATPGDDNFALIIRARPGSERANSCSACLRVINMQLRFTHQAASREICCARGQVSLYT